MLSCMIDVLISMHTHSMLIEFSDSVSDSLGECVQVARRVHLCVKSRLPSGCLASKYLDTQLNDNEYGLHHLVPF